MARLLFEALFPCVFLPTLSWLSTVKSLKRTVNYTHGIWYQLGDLYFSLPEGLKIAVAPSRAMSPPERTSRYAHKPLPLLPPLPSKSSNQRLGHNRFSNSLDITATQRGSAFPNATRGRDRSGSIKKIENLLRHKLDRVARQPTLEELARNSNQGGPPQLPEIEGLTTLDHQNHVDTFSDIHRYMRSDSEYSLSSASAYCQDNIVEKIVDIYSKWGSWQPNSEFPTSPVKRSLYFQPSMHSVGATELGYASHASNIRRPGRASLDGAQIYPQVTTIAGLITEERESFGGNDRFSRGHMTTSFHDQKSLEANTLGYPPLNDDDFHKHDFTPHPLVLRPKGLSEPHRSMSRWSDHSSDGGMISNARDSVISHIRNISSPFKVLSRPSIVFKEKAVTSTIQVPPPARTTRKRAFSSGKHSLRSPFPFRSPPHKKAHSDDSQNLKQPSLARRISDSFKNFSGTRHSPIVNSQIISNHARSGVGPDTPMPTKPGLMGIISPAAILFQKGTLQIQDVMQRAKRAAGFRSRDERRRDKLRKEIVVVGTVDPSSTVSRWL
jgi:hypothetical protein